MKNIIFTILALFSLCQTSSAYDNLLIKKKDGKVVIHDIQKVVDVTFEDINETTVMDISYTGFDFKILTDSTVELSKFKFYCEDKKVIVPVKVRIDGKIYDVTSIGTGAFCECNVKDIDIYAKLTNIGDMAFSYCFNLTDIKIPSSVKKSARVLLTVVIA